MTEIVREVRLIVNEFGNGFINLEDGRIIYIKKGDIFKWWIGKVDAKIWEVNDLWYGHILEQDIIGRVYVGQIHHTYNSHFYCIIHGRGQIAIPISSCTDYYPKYTWVKVQVTENKNSIIEGRIVKKIPNDVDEIAQELFDLEELKETSDATLNIPVRKDLTDLYTFTIDGPTTQDCDDAFSVKDEGIIWRVWVHISDVSEYFNPEKTPELFWKIVERGTTIYGDKRCWPMIPSNYAHNICSILPDKITKTHTCEFTVNKETGEVAAVNMYWSQIKSSEKRTYESPGDLTGLREGAIWIKKQMDELDFYKPEYESMDVVKFWMIMTNCTMAKTIHRIYRSHPAPPPDSIKRFTESGETREAFKEYIKTHKTDLDIWRMKRIMPRANYNEDEKMGHWALGIFEPEVYTHWTSPIRRGTDLLNQCLLKGYKIDNVQQMIQKINEARVFSDTVERWYTKFQSLQKMTKGLKLSGQIVDVLPTGIVVYIGEPYSDSTTIHISQLSKEHLEYNNKSLISSTKSYKINDTIELSVKSCEFGSCVFEI
jgi:exoribonuclease R